MYSLRIKLVYVCIIESERGGKRREEELQPLRRFSDAEISVEI
jgi:hypothetical protein